MMRAYQATCVAIGARAVLIEGPSGSGKSSLALALIDRGAVLVGDDGVMLEVAEGRLFASPHPNTRGLIEVRNLGLIEGPVRDKVMVALVLRLDEAAPRHIDHAERIEMMGITLPMLRLWPGSPVQHLKAELALRKFGLSGG
jgi:serine kinase of HPr protein (carbohydrate metabolism regulator)